MTVDDDTTRDDIIEAIRNVNREAKRLPIFSPQYPGRHAQINELLDHLYKPAQTS